MLVSSNSTTKSELLATTLRSIGDAVVTTDLEANITFLNPMAELLTGWSAQEAVGRKSYEIMDLTEEGNGGTLKCPVMVVLETGQATGYRNHTLLKSKDGSTRAISHNATPLRDLDGNLQGVVLVFHCAQARMQQWQSEERMQLVARATSDAVWDWDLVRNRIWWNDSVTTLFGYTDEEVEGRPDWFLSKIHPEDRERVQELFASAREDMRYWQTEYRFANVDGSYSVVFERGYVLRDPVGKAVRMVGTMMDITGRRLAQEELLGINQELEFEVEQRTEDLKRTNRELESFSYSVSHDLRSPLRNIITLSRMLLEDNEGKLDHESQQNLRELVSNSKRMSDLIQDMLQYSRLSRTKLQVEKVDLTAVAKHAAEEVCAGDAECMSWIRIEDDMVAEADASLVMILFANLIGNAVKFSALTASPSVEVGSAVTNGELVFFVKDNGVGFDPKDATKLFVPFERLHSESDFPGTGIGLANVARIVQRHGGRAWAVGEVDKGATFFFTLA